MTVKAISCALAWTIRGAMLVQPTMETRVHPGIRDDTYELFPAYSYWKLVAFKQSECPLSAFSIFQPFSNTRDHTGTWSTSARQAMRLFIAAVVVVFVSGCAGTGFTDLSTLQKGPNGKTWTQETFESKGSE